MKSIFFFCACTILSLNVNGQNHSVQKHIDANGYSYETTMNDPVGLRKYTLNNGFTVYLARNVESPRVLYATAVRAGSKYDPADNTGLAHYLEHLLFNGSNKIGTLNWEKEVGLLREIEELYEIHKQESDTNEKKEIFQKIDSLSLLASGYGIKGEYRKLATAIGAVGVNGTTNFEHVIFGSLVPVNSLEKFLQLERERFMQPSFRGFHTELEIVYEEYNSRQDNEFLIKYEAANKALFPTHPYGSQNAIGKSDHLKNPSLRAVKQYYDRFFVPTNMAVIIVGNIDFKKTIQWCENAFGGLKKKPLAKTVYSKEKPIAAPIQIEITSAHRPSVLLAFRMNGIGSDDVKYLTVLDKMLQNSVAGMLNLELKNKGKLKQATSFGFFTNNDYSVHYLDGHPNEGQTLEDVKEQLLSVLEKIKKGEFEDWLIKATARDLYRTFVKEVTTNNLETWLASSFTRFQTWSEHLSFMDALQKISKNELIAFANRVYKNNYIVVYKRQVTSAGFAKVKKPVITPIRMNEDSTSAFARQFLKVKPKSAEPVFIDYKSVIRQYNLKNEIPVSFIKNNKNDLFELDIVFDMGKNHDKKIPLAVNYLDLIGTDKYNPGDWKKEFYRLGLSFKATARNSQTIFHIEGLEENLPAGIQLIDHLLSSAKPLQSVYDNYIENLINNRKSMAFNKNSLLQALNNYVLYDGQSPFQDLFSEVQLKSIAPGELTQLIKSIRKYQHRIHYYGSDVDRTISSLNKYYHVLSPMQETPRPKEFALTKTKPAIYLINYESAQSEVMFVSRTEKFDKKVMALSNMFNRFIEKAFFQLIREARSLAYDNWSLHNIAIDSSGYNNMEVYAGTQNDKVIDVLEVVSNMMKDISSLESIFNEAKEDQLNRYRNERITGPNIFRARDDFKKLGIGHDYRKDMYEQIQKMTFGDIKTFFASNVANNDYAILIVGKKENIDLNKLRKFGEIIEIQPTQIF
jgi:zinc protease